MTPTPFEWNVVIVASWNLAILTPRGIAAKLLELPSETSVEVQVMMDVVSIPRVQYGGVLVVPSREQLIVQLLDAEEHDAKHVEHIASIAKRAISALPETPMSAAGVNFRYKWDNAPVQIVELFSDQMDVFIADLDHTTTAKAVEHRLVWRDGFLNMKNTFDDRTGQMVTLLNFSRQSSSPSDLTSWLTHSGEMFGEASRIIEALQERG